MLIFSYLFIFANRRLYFDINVVLRAILKQH